MNARHWIGPVALLALASAAANAQECIECHLEVTPKVVSDWRLSAHSASGVICYECHGKGHDSANDVDLVQLPTLETCGNCHAERVEQFSKGKHALAWTAMEAMPGVHAMSASLFEGREGCIGCHKLGIKGEGDLHEIKSSGSGFGHASCDACHTRHLFSLDEARQPQACQTCHMGFDQAQWDAYSSSKHGVRYLLKQSGTLGAEAAAPTCQTCHMPGSDHEVRTAWGFLAVRMPLPEDPQWRADQTTIMQALGILDSEGNPTERMQAVEATDMARLTREDFDRERDEMMAVCGECHSENFARAEIEKGDRMIREADHLLAEALRVVASLYQDGVLDQPENMAGALPDLLAFHETQQPIEQRLFDMHQEHRMRAVQGAFHTNPDLALRQGWRAMVRALSEIREMDAELRGR